MGFRPRGDCSINQVTHLTIPFNDPLCKEGQKPVAGLICR